MTQLFKTDNAEQHGWVMQTLRWNNQTQTSLNCKIPLVTRMVWNSESRYLGDKGYWLRKGMAGTIGEPEILYILPGWRLHRCVHTYMHTHTTHTYTDTNLSPFFEKRDAFWEKRVQKQNPDEKYIYKTTINYNNHLAEHNVCYDLGLVK